MNRPADPESDPARPGAAAPTRESAEHLVEVPGGSIYYRTQQFRHHSPAYYSQDCRQRREACYKSETFPTQPHA